MAGQHDENGFLFRSRNGSGEHKTEKKSEDRFHAGECLFTARLGQWESKPKVEAADGDSPQSLNPRVGGCVPGVTGADMRRKVGRDVLGAPLKVRGGSRGPALPDNPAA